MSLLARYRLARYRLDDQQHAEAGRKAISSIGHVGAVPCAGPNGFGAVQFTGTGRSVIDNPDGDEFSITTTGQLTVAFRMYADVATFTGEGSTTDYVYPIAKGLTGSHEWAIRFYSAHSATRPNHISAYAFNTDGGFGAGARFATPLAAQTWHHIAAVYNLIDDTIGLYVNGAAAASGERVFEFQGTRIYPKATAAPIHMGRRGNGEYFLGRLSDVRLYNHALSQAEVVALAAETA